MSKLFSVFIFLMMLTSMTAVRANESIVQTPQDFILCKALTEYATNTSVRNFQSSFKQNFGDCKRFLPNEFEKWLGQRQAGLDSKSPYYCGSKEQCEWEKYDIASILGSIKGQTEINQQYLDGLSIKDVKHAKGKTIDIKLSQKDREYIESLLSQQSQIKQKKDAQKDTVSASSVKSTTAASVQNDAVNKNSNTVAPPLVNGNNNATNTKKSNDKKSDDKSLGGSQKTDTAQSSSWWLLITVFALSLILVLVMAYWLAKRLSESRRFVNMSNKKLGSKEYCAGDVVDVGGQKIRNLQQMLQDERKENQKLQKENQRLQDENQKLHVEIRRFLQAQEDQKCQNQSESQQINRSQKQNLADEINHQQSPSSNQSSTKDDAASALYFDKPESDGSFPCKKGGKKMKGFHHYKLSLNNDGSNAFFEYMGLAPSQAIRNYQSLLEPVCEIENIQDINNATRIVTVELGIVELRGDEFQLRRKCKIRLEL